MRANPSQIVDGSPLNMNFHAGSAMFLEANSLYDIKLILNDPDGGGETIDLEIKTRQYPTFPTNGMVTVVSQTDGMAYIQNLIDNASPGDIIEFQDGVYSTLEIMNDSVFLRAQNLHGAVFDGSGTDRGILTVGVFNDSIQHVMISGFIIRNGKWGIDAQNTQYLTVQNCDIVDVDYGIVNRRANGWEHDQYITNNRLVGRTPWPQSNGNIPSERGIDIRGNNHVVSFNSILLFWGWNHGGWSVL